VRDKIKRTKTKDKRFPAECYSCGIKEAVDWYYNHGTNLSLCDTCWARIRTTRGIDARRTAAKKICYACGSTKTKIRYKKNRRPNAEWIYNLDDENNVLCKRCYYEIIEYRARRELCRCMTISFKGRQIYLHHNPKKGICQVCNRSVSAGEIKRTNMHHEEYDEKDPLAYTVELCVNCHNHRHPERYRR
jgi:hypothetical protein